MAISSSSHQVEDRTEAEVEEGSIKTQVEVIGSSAKFAVNQVTLPSIVGIGLISS